MPSANTVAQMVVVVDADTSKAESGLKGLGTSINSTGSALSTAFAGAAVAGIAAVGVGLAACVTSAADFEKTMSAVKAVSGATADEMTTLSNKALELGAKTSFSASEAAAGIEELIKGGLSIPDVMNGAAEATLNLAAAGGVSLPEAATIAANALNQFNLGGEDMAHVADLIAGAANASSLDVNDFSYSLKAAGAVAATVGFSFDDLAQGIAVMGKAGIAGSDAGTSLKTMMLNLQPSTKAQIAEFERLGLATVNSSSAFSKLQAALLQSAEGQKLVDKHQKAGTLTAENLWKAADKLGLSAVAGTTSYERWLAVSGDLNNSFFDSEGKVKSMAQVAEALQVSMKDLTEQERLASLEILFGSDAIRAGAVLAKEGAAGFNDMAAAMGKVSAETVGAEKLNNLAGSVEGLKGSLETMAIMIGLELTPILNEMVKAVTVAANEAMPSMQAAAQALAATIKAWMPALKAVAGFLWENRDAILAVVAVLATFAILSTVVGWFLAISAGISAVTAAISGAGGVLAALGALVAILGGPVTLIIAAIAIAVGLLAYAWSQNWGDIQGKTAAVVDFLSGIPDMIAGFFQAIDDSAVALRQAVDDAWDGIKQKTTEVWNSITQFLEDWWRTILVALTGPVGLLAVLIIDNWETIKTTTETIFRAIANILTAIWGEIQSQIIGPAMDRIKTVIGDAWDAVKSYAETVLNGLLSFIRDRIFEPIRAAVETAIHAARDLLAAAWDAMKAKAEAVFTPLLTWWQQTIWEPIRAAVETAINAAQTLFATAVDAIKTKAEAILNPLLTWWSTTIWEPMRAAVNAALYGESGAVTLFNNAVTGIKTTVDTTLAGIKTVWETTWQAIKTAAESPQAALKVLTDLVVALDKIMPKYLIPHSPTPFQIGIEGITNAAKEATAKVKTFMESMAGGGDAGGEVRKYIIESASERGIDPSVALRVAHHEGGEDSYMRVGKFATGWSFWPFQLHYGGRGYEHFGTTAGMGTPFTRKTGLQPGDKEAWDESIDYALTEARKHGWGQWYGRIPAGVGAWEGIPGHQSGGWVGLHGPELGWLGERGPEYVVPNSAVRGGGGHQTMTLNVAIGGRVAEQIVVEGYDLAVRRGRLPVTGLRLAGASR
jgi:TP901 family phage tail tape measure protein